MHSCHENSGAAEPPPSGPHALGSLHDAGLDKPPALTSRRSWRCGQPAECPLGPGATLRVAHRLVVGRQALGDVAADAVQHCTAHTMAMPDSNGPGAGEGEDCGTYLGQRAAVGRCQPDSAMLSATCDGEEEDGGPAGQTPDTHVRTGAASTPPVPRRCSSACRAAVSNAARRTSAHQAVSSEAQQDRHVFGTLGRELSAP